MGLGWERPPQPFASCAGQGPTLLPWEPAPHLFVAFALLALPLLCVGLPQVQRANLAPPEPMQPQAVRSAGSVQKARTAQCWAPPAQQSAHPARLGQCHSQAQPLLQRVRHAHQASLVASHPTTQLALPVPVGPTLRRPQPRRARSALLAERCILLAGIHSPPAACAMQESTPLQVPPCAPPAPSTPFSLSWEPLLPRSAKPALVARAPPRPLRAAPLARLDFSAFLAVPAVPAALAPSPLPTGQAASPAPAFLPPLMARLAWCAVQVCIALAQRLLLPR